MNTDWGMFGLFVASIAVCMVAVWVVNKLEGKQV